VNFCWIAVVRIAQHATTVSMESGNQSKVKLALTVEENVDHVLNAATVFKMLTKQVLTVVVLTADLVLHFAEMAF
jgi:hypothetical protein